MRCQRMVLFLVALVAALVGVAAYWYYNPGAHDVTVMNFRFAGVPDWEPVAVVAGVVLLLFLIHAIRARGRIRKVRLAIATTPEGRQRVVRSWSERQAAEAERTISP